MIKLGPSRSPAVIFLASAAITCASWVVLRPNFLADSSIDFADLSPDYRGMVRDLIAGRGLVSFRYPPAFPLSLAGIQGLAKSLGLRDRIVLATFIAAGTALTSTLVYLIARGAWGSRRAAFAALAWMTYPPALYTASFVGSETPFMALLLAGILLYQRGLAPGSSRRAPAFFACGFLLGMAMLTRPIAIGLGLLLAVLLWPLRVDRACPRRRGGWAALILLGNIVAILPWQLWMYVRTGQMAALSTGGTPTILDGLTYAVDPKDGRKVRVPDDVRRLQLDIYDRQYRELNSTRTIAAYLGRQFTSRPAAVLKLVAIKAGNCWYRTDSSRHDRSTLFLQALYLPILSAGTAVGWKRGGATRELAILAVAMLIYFWAMTTMALSILRYMVPAFGLIFAVAPGALLPQALIRTGNGRGEP